MTEDPTLLTRLRAGLQKTHQALRAQVATLFGSGPVDAATLDGLEEALLQADTGVPMAAALLQALRQRARTGSLPDAPAVRAALREEIASRLTVPEPPPRPPAQPWVVLVLGANGSGKTTAIGKLAHRAVTSGERVLLGAADTFRAAGIEQLKAWGERSGAEVIAHQPGADPTAVIFDTLHAARARSAHRVLIDTAGRLHTQRNLMEELRKMTRVLGREVPGAPHEVLLVLDATTGRSAVAQAREFHLVAPLTGLILAKLDGTAKGGAILGIVEALRVPVRFLGVGEGLEDLAPFSPSAFAAAFLPD
ncbi:MAG TPA: signal recognition particle-docking protein FtsY [Candidatus Methylomirabilis sp.]|nr:signal recognition particle-docking protein FtsY [Candidatus Methylomirabilis sp.]